MHKKVSQLQNKLLALLFNGGRELDSFTLFKRAKIGFSDFTLTINGLIESQLIVEVEDKLRLSDTGVSIVLQVGSGVDDKVWRRIPEKLVAQRIQPNQPYTPSVRLLDRKTFKSLKIDVD